MVFQLGRGGKLENMQASEASTNVATHTKPAFLRFHSRKSLAAHSKVTCG